MIRTHDYEASSSDFYFAIESGPGKFAHLASPFLDIDNTEV